MPGLFPAALLRTAGMDPIENRLLSRFGLWEFEDQILENVTDKAEKPKLDSNGAAFFRSG